jgi:WD40 repeat protein/3',5'-cyclic AMP phosphodiesterase CpdA
MAPSGVNQPATEFFISYSPEDERWASWIAWQLEMVGNRTMLQAWDFVPGTDWVDLMDRGVREGRVLIVILSRSYEGSRNGQLEWHSAILQHSPRPLVIPVRIDDCVVRGLLASITYVDLADVDDPEQAKALLMRRINDALAGRAKPVVSPGYPPLLPSQVRRLPPEAPQFPPRIRSQGPRDSVSVLHVHGPSFGRAGERGQPPATAAQLQERVYAGLESMEATRPDLLVVTGNLTATGSMKESSEAYSFLSGLRTMLGLEPQRVLVVPGSRDVNMAACRAYFNNCEADDTEPHPPYWPKWRHYAGLFANLYHGLKDRPVFESAQPWTLFTIGELRVVVAGLNSTMAHSHLQDDGQGWLGDAQAAWFEEVLRPFQRDGWLRIGLVAHAPATEDDNGSGTLGAPEGPLARVAPRLNLIFHGGAGEPAARQGLFCLPSPSDAQYQVVELTKDGLTTQVRAAGEPVTRSQRFDVAWQSVSAAFTGASDAAAPVPVREVPAEPDRVPGPADDLLAQVTEVCQIKYDEPRIREERGELASLLISYTDRDVPRQLRIGVHSGTPTEESVERLRGMTYSSEVAAELVYKGAPPPAVLQDHARQSQIKLTSFQDFECILDLSDYVSRQTARLAANTEGYAPGRYVPQRFLEFGPQLRPASRDDIVGELLATLSRDEGRLAIVLGNFGHGKTFAMRELARRIPEEHPHLIPILMELRTLDKSHSVEAMVAAHLADQGMVLSDLRAFRYLLNHGRLILLFDGFDELVARITYERATEHLDQLLGAGQDNAKIVITGRTQFFRTSDQVSTALSRRVMVTPHWRMLEIENFRTDQIRDFLIHQYNGDTGRAEARLQSLSAIPGLLGLAENPRMLSFIAQFDDQLLERVKQRRDKVTSAVLYRIILTDWLKYEEQRTRAPGTATSLALADLWQAVTALAVALWTADTEYIRLEKLREIASALAGLADGRLSADETAHAVGTGSLLTRTQEGLFGFIHSSVAEWLVANHIARQFADGVELPAELSERTLSDLTIDFLCELAGERVCQDWVQRVLAAPRPQDDRARVNAFRMSGRLHSPPTMDLRGAQFADQDLSHRNYPGVNFADADLSRTTLVRTDLRGANLAGAVLRDAHLEHALLRQADLTGADFTRARLILADLAQVTWTGSTWTRAVLIETTLDPEMARSAELSGAAVVSRDRRDQLRIEVSPAAIGVPYGFSGELGRLPEALAYNADGSLLAVGNNDGSVLICEGQTGRALRTLRGHGGRVYGVRFAAGRGPLVTCAADATVRLWDAATGKELRTLPECKDWVWPLVLSPDGTSLLTGDGAGTVTVWDVETGQPRYQLARHDPPVWSAAFSPRDDLLVTGDSGTARVWDAVTGEPLYDLIDHGGSVFRTAFSPAGADGDMLLATGDHKGVIRLWDAATGELKHVLGGQSGSIYCMAFSPDGRWLAAGSTGRSLWVWDTRAGKRAQTLTGHAGGVYWVQFSPDGKLLASGDSLGGLRLWDSATGHMVRDLDGHRGAVWPFQFRPDGGHLATASDDGTVRLWDTTGQGSSRALRGHGRRIKTVRFDPAGERIASCGNDGHVRLWSVRAGEQERNLASATYSLLDSIFSKEGGQLATTTNDGLVTLWNPQTGAIDREINVVTDYAWALAFSPEGKLLATANDDDSVSVWYWETGRMAHQFRDHRGRVRSIAFTPDGLVLATGCDDSMVRLWDPYASKGEIPPQAVLAGHADRVYEVAFAPDAGFLLSASWDGTARLWDVASRRCTQVLRHGGRVWAAAYSPLGDVVATAGDDTDIRLWDPQSGQPLGILRGHSMKVTSLAFSPDGTTLVSGADDGLVLLWDLRGEHGPRLRLTMLGLPKGWVSFAPDGRYKCDGEIDDQFWHAVGTCRFEPGELDRYIRDISRLAPGDPF